MDLFVAQLLNGLVYGVLLFLMAAGLSLIFGLMNVVSLAHGSFFMLGAYVGLSTFQATGSFWLALALAPIPVIATGVVMERLFMRPLYRRGHCEAIVTIQEVEERADGVKLQAGFSELDAEAERAIAQYAKDIAFLKKELSLATGGKG